MSNSKQFTEKDPLLPIKNPEIAADFSIPTAKPKKSSFYQVSLYTII